MPEPFGRWMAITDNHGDMIDPQAERAAREFCKWFKPNRRIHMGDVWDFRALRRGAGDEEKREPIRADFDAGMELLSWFKPQVLLRGNHDERLFDCAANARNATLADFCLGYVSEIASRLKGVEVLPYSKRHGVYRMGHLKFIHGYNSGITAARLAAQAYGNVLMGHVHACDVFSIPGLEPREGRAIGCLCRLDMDYNRAQLNTLRQAHGFAYGLVWPNGKYTVWQARDIEGVWVFPSEFKIWEASHAQKAG